MHKKKDIDQGKAANSQDFSPYDSLVSNRGVDESNMYMQREKNSRLQLSENPTKAFNTPPWMGAAESMGDVRREAFGGLHGDEMSLHGGGAEMSKVGQSNEVRGQTGGLNVFARMKKIREEKKNALDPWSHRNKKKRKRTFLAGASRRGI